MGNLSYPKISFPAKASPQAVKKANYFIRRLNYIKVKDKEFFELNGGSLRPSPASPMATTSQKQSQSPKR